MTHRFNIKRFWLVVGLLLLVECAALWAYRSCSRTLPESQCSEVYRRYAHVPENNTWVWRSKNRHPEERVIQEAGDEVLEIVILDIKKHEIGVFHTNTKEEESAVFDKKIDSNI